MIIPPEKFITSSIRASPHRYKICQLLSSVIHSADAGLIVKNIIQINSGRLVVKDKPFNLNDFRRIFIIGAGKAVVPMASAICDLLGTRLTAGLVIAKDGYIPRNDYTPELKIRVIEAAHPIPEQRNIDATTNMLALVSNLKPDDLVICLISGGGSALMTKPSKGLSLRDLQETTATLLRCGASIDEINIIRKHIDDVKGGGLIKQVSPAAVITLLLSDVIGDRLDSIASGLTVPDPSTYKDAWSILAKYQVVDRLPDRVISHITAGVSGMLPETLKPGGDHSRNINNFVIGNNDQIMLAAMSLARGVGFNPIQLPFPLTGEASLMGEVIIEHIKANSAYDKNGLPDCFVTGGETTVTVKGNGMGGRNQELVLGAVRKLSGPERMLLVSLATDGGDGQTDAAGAVATNQTYSASISNGFDPETYLEHNDAYNFFNQLGDLIKIGPTLTNVNDIAFIFRG